MSLSTSGVDRQVYQAIGVSPFIIVPGNNLVKVVVEKDAGTSIDSGGGRVVNEIAGYKLFFGVTKDTLHITFGCLFERTKDFFLSSSLFSSEGQIDDGNIGGRDLYFCRVQFLRKNDVKK